MQSIDCKPNRETVFNGNGGVVVMWLLNLVTNTHKRVCKTNWRFFYSIHVATYIQQGKALFKYFTVHTRCNQKITAIFKISWVKYVQFSPFFLLCLHTCLLYILVYVHNISHFELSVCFRQIKSFSHILVCFSTFVVFKKMDGCLPKCINTKLVCSSTSVYNLCRYAKMMQPMHQLLLVFSFLPKSMHFI